MARYKAYNYAQMKMVAVSYERQILLHETTFSTDSLGAIPVKTDDQT